MDEFKKMSNKEFINWLIDYSKAGGMMQVFIIQALDYYSKEIIKKDKEDTLNWPEKYIISKDYWVSTAVELRNNLEAKYALQNVREEGEHEGSDASGAVEKE